MRWCAGTDKYGQRAPWRGLTLTPVMEANRLSRVNVTFEYHEVTSVLVPAKVSRRGAEAVTEFLMPHVDRFIDGLEEAAEVARSDARRYKEQAAEALQAAQSAVFADEERLADARARLARVDSLIAEEAAEPVAA